MKYYTVRKGDLPNLFKTVGTRKHSMTLVVLTDDRTVEIRGLTWDGGCRSCYGTLSPTGTRNLIPQAGRENVKRDMFGTVDGYDYAIPAGLAILEAGTFRGKAAHPTLYIHADDLDAFGIGLEDDLTVFETSKGV